VKLRKRLRVAPPRAREGVRKSDRRASCLSNTAGRNLPEGADRRPRASAGSSISSSPARRKSGLRFQGSRARSRRRRTTRSFVESGARFAFRETCSILPLGSEVLGPMAGTSKRGLDRELWGGSSSFLRHFDPSPLHL